MNKLLSHPLVVTGITILFLLFWWSLYRTMTSFSSSRERLVELRTEVNHQAEQVRELELQLQLAQDPLTKEKIARNELLQQKPGEYVVKVDLPSAKKNSAQKLMLQSPWEEWRKLLF